MVHRSSRRSLTLHHTDDTYFLPSYFLLFRLLSRRERYVPGEERFGLWKSLGAFHRGTHGNNQVVEGNGDLISSSETSVLRRYSIVENSPAFAEVCFTYFQLIKEYDTCNIGCFEIMVQSEKKVISHGCTTISETPLCYYLKKYIHISLILHKSCN